MWADLDTTLKDSLIASVEEGLRMNKYTVPYKKRLTNRVNNVPVLHFKAREEQKY